MRLSLLLAAVGLLATPARAAAPLTDNTINVISSPFTKAERSVPPQLSVAQRARYKRIFQAIEAGRITAATQDLATMPRGVLHSSAEGQILLAQGVSAGLTRLVGWLEANPAAPQAGAIARLARRAGATTLPPLTETRRLFPVNLTPPLAPRSVGTQSRADQEFAAAARRAVSAERPQEVAAMLKQGWPDLSADVRSEWTQRAGWIAYLNLDDGLAEQLAVEATKGSGEWAAMGHWVAGLAAFRQNRPDAASRHFDGVNNIYTASRRLRAASAYWAARSHVRSGRPQEATSRLRAAMDRDPDGFYGLLAAEALGLSPAIDWREPDFIQADWTTLKGWRGARRAAALAEIGQTALADRELRQLAMIASSDELYEPVLRLAARLDLPATQYWVAQNPPPGTMPPMSARFPTPDWKPVRGWRVPRTLVFAHALQESKFIATARSGAGAQGAMQIMPGTARDLARALNIPVSTEQLADPAFSVEFGQSYLEMMRDSVHTGGLLPKVIAAYNAGPGSVQKWNAGALRDNDDLLLFVASIPFLETRHYTEVVLRNYWLYQMKAAAEDPSQTEERMQSLREAAANIWPKFPQGLAGN